ncbi:hypothetical protein [Cetobacterium sp.]|uniref:hypothetical protein n=1 Tax=Cetobacterium sp. TaxID=2071632 RepID=UPI003F31CAAD
MIKIPLYIYDYDKYQEIVKSNRHSCYTTSFNQKDYFAKGTQQSDRYMKELLEISKNRCYMCGFSLETNHSNGIYFEREHIINQSITKDRVKKCKKNIIPICRICNSKKTKVNSSQLLEADLNLLNINCKWAATNHFDCTYEDTLLQFKNENFDYSLSSKNYKNYPNIEFDILFKIFIGNSEYIEKFHLNSRTNIIFDNIFKVLYETNFSNYENLKKYITEFSQSSLDDEFLNYLESCNLLECDNDEMEKRDELIELITLLEVLE